MAPVLCPAISSKRSLLGLGWSVNAVLTFISFISALIITTAIQLHYQQLAWNEQSNGNYADQGESGDRESGDHDREGGRWLFDRALEGGEGSNDHQSEDKQREVDYTLLASVQSSAITFSFFYITILAVCMTLFGSMAVVGFTSIRGRFIEPCFPTEPTDVMHHANVATVYEDIIKERATRKTNLKIGIFMGMLVLFANLCLVTAVILGEVRVIDKDEDEERNDGEPMFAIEKIARVLAVMCIIVAVSHFLYSILFFAFRSSLIETGFSDRKEHFHSTTESLGSDTIRQRHHQSHIGVVVGDSVIYSPPSLMSSPKYSS